MIKKIIFLPVLCVLQTSLLVAKTGEEQIDISGDNNVVNKTVSGDINNYNLSSPMSTDFIELKDLVVEINKKITDKKRVQTKLKKNFVRITFSEDKLACNKAIEDKLYIKKESFKRFISNYYRSSNTVAIAHKETEIRVWQSDDMLLSECTNSWPRISGIAPKNERVLAVGSNCQFNKPTNNSKRFLQFVFYIGAGKITKGKGYGYPFSGELGYYKSSDDYGKGKVNKVKVSDVGLEDIQINRSACLNIELNYCGDGILQSKHEQCDYKINSASCSAECKTI